MKTTLLLSLFSLLLLGCSSPSPKKVTPTGEPPIAIKKMDEPSRVIRVGDLIKITFQFPGRTISSLEAVQKEGSAPTPDGSLMKASGLSLETFRANMVDFYKTLPGYEAVQIEAYIYCSPYSVIRMNPNAAPKDSTLPAPTIFPRIFKAPLTVWEAIQLEGGFPPRVDPSHIGILKATTARKSLNCSGKNGEPDGKTIVDSGDYIFLVPDDVPVSKIFD